VTLAAPSTAVFMLDALAGANTWCVYEHHLIRNDGMPPEVIFVGSTRLSDLFSCKDARMNSDWLPLMNAYGPSGPKIMIRIIATTDDPVEANNTAIRHLRTFDKTPRCNLHGFNNYRRTAFIMCSNGKLYTSQVEAATELGIKQPAISRVLRGGAQHASGYSFTYATQEDIDRYARTGQ